MEQTGAYDPIVSIDTADAGRATLHRVEHVACYWSGTNAEPRDPQVALSYARIDALVRGLPPMEELWARLPARDAVAQLQHRDRVLGVATLSWRSVRLLHELLRAVGAPTVIWRHAPSRRAGDKQTVLDARQAHPRVWVNKTVTLRLGSTHLLCTGVGDFTLARSLLAAVAQALHLPTRRLKACQINPVDYAPEHELGLLTGMVSPFVAPGQSAYRFQGVILLTDPDDGWARHEHMVAVSLSPCESLLVPLAHFRVLTQQYAQRAYPMLRWLAMESARGGLSCQA